MVKKIDDQTLDRAVKALLGEYVYSIGVSNLSVQKDYKLFSSESLEDECFDVGVDQNAPDDYQKNLPPEFEGYKVFYTFGRWPEPL